MEIGIFNLYINVSDTSLVVTHKRHIYILVGIYHFNLRRNLKMEFETFYDELKEHNKVLRVTVPYKLVEFAGLKTGDKVKVMIRKMEE